MKKIIIAIIAIVVVVATCRVVFTDKEDTGVNDNFHDLIEAIDNTGLTDIEIRSSEYGGDVFTITGMNNGRSYEYIVCGDGLVITVDDGSTNFSYCADKG